MLVSTLKYHGNHFSSVSSMIMTQSLIRGWNEAIQLYRVKMKCFDEAKLESENMRLMIFI